MKLDRPTSSFGLALKQRREERRMSQLELALEANVSTRHVSFLETERAKPSREMVLGLAEALLLPRADTNALLASAGFAPVFTQSNLQAEALAPVRAAMTEMMARHAPWPAMLLDRHWNILKANDTATALLAPLSVPGRALNAIELMCDVDRAGAVILNLVEVQRELLARVRLERLEAGMDGVLAAHEARLRAALATEATTPTFSGQAIVPIRIHAFGQTLSFLTTIAHFGSSEDITVRDLRLELLFPADEVTRGVFG